MSADTLAQTARGLVAPGKGILAADESFPTIEKRFKSLEIESTEDNRRAYRDMLFATEGLGEHISGVILFDETIRQTASDGTPFPEVLTRAGVIPGIKVDKGAKDLALAEGEKVTEGLDGLRDRLEEYRELGARFTKWRAVITIAGEDLPSDYCIWTNAHALARYAALSQEAGLVPIVEPEVLMDGDHTIERCYSVTSRTLQAVFTELYDQRVDFEGMLLKTNMVLSGKQRGEDPPEVVADQTLRCFYRVVPAGVPGVVFLSGGQGDEQATANLNAMNQTGPHPWELSFSYGRALQAPALKAWAGDEANIEAGQRALAKRAKLNGLARSGDYSSEMEREEVGVS